jgi:hypothetical protein
MIPRWIVPDREHQGELKLFVGPKPIDAICEAPHNFTNEMEPYFILHEGLDPKTGQTIPVTVSWHKDYLRDLQLGRLRKKGHKIPHPEIPKTSYEIHIKKAVLSRNEQFNSLKPHQRFVFSILGDLVHKPKFKRVHRFIFKEKL